MAHHLFNQVLTHQVSEEAAVEQTDENFANVVLLLKGDGSDGQGNTADLGNPSYKAFEDGSTSAHDITINGDSYGNDFSPYYYDDGYWSNAFDQSDYTDIASSSDFAFGTGDFTVEFWVYLTKTPASDLGIFDSRTTNGAYVYIMKQAAGKFVYYVNTGARIYSNANAQSNRWYHLAVVRNSGTTYMYVDGVQQTQTYTDSTNYLTTGIRLGANRLTGTEHFPGFLSNVRVVNGTALYTTGFAPSTSPFTDPTTSGELSTYFDGSGDYLTVPDSTDFTIGTNNFSLEFWIYPTRTATQEVFYSQSNSAGSSYPIIVEKTTANKLYLYMTSSAQNYQLGTTVLSMNQWYFIQVTRTASQTVKLYLNGVEEISLSLSSSTIVDATTDVQIGRAIFGRQYQGYISNLRFRLGAASPYSTLSVPTTPLTSTGSETKLLTCQSKTFSDESDSSQPISTYGNARISEFGPFGDGYWSNYFDGTGDYLTTNSTNAIRFTTGAYTVEMWIFPLTGSGERGIFSTSGSSIYGISMWRSGTTLYLEERATAYNSANPRLTGTITLNKWSHIALSRDSTSGTLRGFIDGTQFSSTTTNLRDIQGYAATIGDNASTANSFDGYISNVRLTNLNLYTGTFTPSTTPFTSDSNTKLLACQSSRFIENSSTGLTITVSGNTSINEFTPFEYLKRQTKLITSQGNRFKDIIPNRHSITLTGDPDVSTNTPFTQSKTVNVGSGYFDGTGDYVSVADSTDFTFSNSDFTVECWVYFKTASGTQYVYGQSHSSAASATSIQLYSSGTTIYGWTGFGSASGTIKAKEWTHVAFVRQSDTLYLYLNGKLSGTAAAGTNSVTDSTGVFALGRVGAYDAAYFNGYISDFNLINGTAKYSSNFTPPSSTISAHANTKLLTCQYSGAVRNVGFLDDSKYNRSLTRNGDISMGTFSPFSAEDGYWSTYHDTASDAWVRFAGSGATDFNLDDGASWCVEFFLYMEDVHVAYRRIAEHYVSTEYWAIKFDSGGVGKICIGRTDTPGDGDLASASALPEHQWVHVAFTNDGSTLRLFVDGVLSNSKSSWTQSWANATGGTPSVQFCNYRSLGYTLKGSISNFRIVKGDSVYTSAFTVPSEPLTAITGTQLLCAQSNRHKDNSTNNYAATAGNSSTTNGASPPIVQPFSPFTSSNSYKKDVKGGSTYFDGSGDGVTSDTSFDISFGTGGFTFECFAYPTTQTYSGVKVILDLRYSNNSSTDNMSAIVWTGTQMDCYSGSSASSGSDLSFMPFSWTHLCVQRISGVLYFSTNGKISSTTPSFTRDLSGAGKVTIGGNVGLGVSMYTGYVSNLRLIKGTGIYGTSNFSAPTAPFLDSDSNFDKTIFLSRFDNAGIFDHTSKHNLKMEGDTRISTQEKKFSTGSIYFDGSGDYLTVTNSTLSNTFFSPKEGDYTWEMFVKFAVLSGGSLYTLFSKYGSASEYQFYYNAGNHWNLSHGATTKSWADTSIAIDTWYHIALVKDGTDYELFKDGTSLGTNAFSNPTAGTRPFVLGTTFGGSNNALYQLNGYLDEVRLTKGVARYTSNFTPPTQTFPNK